MTYTMTKTIIRNMKITMPRTTEILVAQLTDLSTDSQREIEVVITSSQYFGIS